MNFLWHSVSEEEKKEIKKQAKVIMDSFAKALAKVDKEIKEEKGSVEREKQTREESRIEEGKSGLNETFRKIFLENAPEKEDDFIKAEKGGWK